MGCDIYTYIETREYSDENWQLTAYQPEFFLGMRDYVVFAFLAGVRNYTNIKPLTPARGIPKDSSLTDEYEDKGGHGASWFTLEELLAIDWEGPIEYTCHQSGHTYTRALVLVLGTLLRDEIQRLRLAFPNYEHANVRLVFFFDN